MGHESSTLPHIGDLIDGRYRIDRILGEGGTSTVYQVSHIITDKKFAIKWLLPELALDEAAVDRFIQEARVGGRFSHPYAVQVYDICKANDSFYMLMEFLEGESLQARLERVGRLPVAAACAIALICTEVLRAAHQAGIIHRDLKPANIFLCAATDLRGEIPKLLDFGISTFCAGLQQSAGAASVIGTPLYMAPEQMLGEPADPRTDIYALGAVLYELVSGRPPFHADNYAELVAQVTGDAQAEPLAQRVPEVDPAFAAIIAKAMAREPAARFASMSELAQALSRFAAEKGISSVLRPSSGVVAPTQAKPRSSGEAGAHASASQRVKPVDAATAADAESEWRAELAPLRSAKLKRSVALALSLGALGVLLAVASGLREDRMQRAAGIASPAAPNALEPYAPSAPEDAPEPTLARWDLPAEPYAFAEERPSNALTARPAARAAGVSRHKPEAASAAKSADAANARKPALREPAAGARVHVEEPASPSHASATHAGAGATHASAVAAPTAASLASASSGSGSALSASSSASGASHVSALPASSLNVSTSPSPRAPAIRMSRSDFAGESAPGARMPTAAVSRQDF